MTELLAELVGVPLLKLLTEKDSSQLVYADVHWLQFVCAVCTNHDYVHDMVVFEQLQEILYT